MSTAQTIGVVLVTPLIAALLLREAVGLGLVKVSGSARRVLNRSIVALAVSFLAAITVHLVTL